MTMRGRPVTLSEDDLLEVAGKVFIERGLDATTAEIAQRARISESVIFHRYKTKEALFTAVFERHIVMPPAFARLPSRVGKGEVADNLFDAGMGVTDAMQRVLPFLMMALSSSKMNVLHKHKRAQHPLKRQMVELLGGYCEGEAELGRLRGIQGAVFARAYLGGIMQQVMSEQVEGETDPLEIPEFLRGLIDLLLHGALPERSRRPLRAAGRQ